ncbi:uncharacterized protein EDB91DRAFT_1082722 [Suillus paluster]|uniref:uncharacterized protein n=1 Tax=Suillus paluster TaxID=48578 RepID=UPI001B86185A|nr:uncharacterized protein EDB91DRAFT_1082722 [Suillus paluster]KAG1738325.1 hypothetical protein EDB91DRAFT_1082722 [Suillus paluster]
MNSHPTVRFNDPPATEYYSMDVDDSTQSGTSTDDLYLGLDDDIEDDSVSSSGPGVLAAIPDQLPPAQYDQPVQYIDPDLYLGPDEDLIDCDDEPGSVYAQLNERPAKCDPAHPEVTNEDLRVMAEAWVVPRIRGDTETTQQRKKDVGREKPGPEDERGNCPQAEAGDERE